MRAGARSWVRARVASGASEALGVAPDTEAEARLGAAIEAVARDLARQQAADGEGATTLEWSLSSPPPFHQFSELPVIEDHHDHHDHIGEAKPA